VLAPLDRRVGGVGGGSASTVYSLGLVGQRLLAGRDGRPARAPWTPSTPYIRHGLLVTELYVGLREQERSGAVELLRFEAEPNCWRAHPTRDGLSAMLKPDAHVVVGVGSEELHWFVEVDRATESIGRVARQCERYRAYQDTGLEQVREDVFPKVLWTVPDERRADQVAAAVRRNQPTTEDLFAVVEFPRALSVLVGDAGGRG
jgi:hypothetical protein